MPSSVTSHSHRSTTKASHKPFKSKKATKGALKELSKGINLVLFYGSSR
jgi:pre-rRNA-processing protein TSR1